MQTEINALLNKVAKLAQRADVLSESENENTAERYDAIREHMEGIIVELEEALTCFY